MTSVGYGHIYFQLAICYGQPLQKCTISYFVVHLFGNAYQIWSLLKILVLVRHNMSVPFEGCEYVWATRIANTSCYRKSIPKWMPDSDCTENSTSGCFELINIFKQACECTNGAVLWEPGHPRHSNTR